MKIASFLKSICVSWYLYILLFLDYFTDKKPSLFETSGMKIIFRVFCFKLKLKLANLQFLMHQIKTIFTIYLLKNLYQFKSSSLLD